MKPGCGNGTLVMTLLRNHSMPFSAARLLTAVGLRRGSIGPPITGIEHRKKGWRAASLTETRPTHHGTRAPTGTGGLAPGVNVHAAAEQRKHLEDEST